MTRVQARITGIGSYLPKRILSNADLETMVETTDEWIVSRTGIKERRIADKEECTSDMGLHAAKAALANAKISPESVDLVLFATMSPDYIAPATAVIIQDRIGAVNAAALDIQAACSGYLYGLSIAKAYIESGLYNTILFIASEKMSSFINYEDRNTCVLFGDGATAAVISSKGEGLTIGPVCLGADGKYFDVAIVPAGGAKKPATEETLNAKEQYFRMEGREVFKHAVRRMEQVSKECLSRANLTENDIQWIIPHQANLRIIEALSKYFPNNNIYRTVHKYGNTSASSVGIALDELIQENNLQKNDKMLVTAFGVGFTWGAAILIKD